MNKSFNYQNYLENTKITEKRAFKIKTLSSEPVL